MKKKVLFLLVLGIFFPLKVKALTGNINLNCNKTTLAPGESTTCTITGSTSEEVSTVSAKIKVGSNLTLVSVKTSSIWQGDGDGGNIDLYTDINKTGTFEIATFTIMANSDIKESDISISSIYFSDASFQQFNVSSISKKIMVSTPDNKPEESKPNYTPAPTPEINHNPTVDKKSNDATLKTLTLDISDFQFNKNKKEYQLEVPYDQEQFQLKAEANDEKATVVLPSSTNLKVGDNDFEIKVIAEDGTTMIYKLNIKRLTKILSNNAYIKNLTIEQYPINFNKEVTNYTLNQVKYDKLNVKIETEDSKATYQIYGNQKLSNDDVIVIKVTAEDGTTKEYFIYITEVLKSKNQTIWILILGIGLCLSMVGNIVMWVKVKKIVAKVENQNPKLENLNS